MNKPGCTQCPPPAGNLTADTSVSASTPSSHAASGTASIASSIYDEPEFRSRYTTAAGDNTQVSMSLSGLHCGACVGLVENAINTINGVKSAAVNLATERLDVTYDSAQTSLSAIIDTVENLGYQARPFAVDEIALHRKRTARTRLKQLSLAGLAAMQTMMFTLPGYLTDTDEMEVRHQVLFQWAGLLLTVPVLLYSARPFWQGAWRSLKNRRPGMDVPVCIAIVCATIASVWNMLNGHADVYFDSIAMFVFLLLSARYLEWSIRNRSAASLETLDASTPQTARLVTDIVPHTVGTCCASANADGLLQRQTNLVPAMRLKAGDLIIVHGGERVPADSIVVEGQSSMDCSLLTGESLPLPVSGGDVVPGGAVIAETPVALRVTDVVEDSALSTISRLAHRGASEKPPLIRKTDLIATLFVSALLMVAVITGLVWFYIDPLRALPVAIAVLVVSCPCALSLATPATLAAATAGLLKQHVLITRSHTLETLNRVTDVVLDKTGTVTVGEPTLVDVQYADGLTRSQVLHLAAHLETGSGHPLAKVIIQAAASLTESDSDSEQNHHLADHNDQALPATSANAAGTATTATIATTGSAGMTWSERLTAGNCGPVQHCAGAGLYTDLKDNPSLQLRLGNAKWCGISDVEKWRDAGTAALSEVFLVATTDHGTTGHGTTGHGTTGHGTTGHGTSGYDASRPDTATSTTVLAKFSFDDVLKPHASSLVSFFQNRGIRVHLLSGDRNPVVQQVGRTLGIAHHHVTAEATPTDKQSVVKGMQAEGKTVLMIGDGINDAPVLASADISVAFGQASALACVSADAVILTSDVEDILSLYRAAKNASWIIRQNLFWAAGYNLLAIPVAAVGLVPPWAAAIGMSVSSLIVAGNASRAARTATAPQPQGQSFALQVTRPAAEAGIPAVRH